jgi:hypothetical protein
LGFCQHDTSGVDCHVIRVGINKDGCNLCGLCLLQGCMPGVPCHCSVG